MRVQEDSPRAESLAVVVSALSQHKRAAKGAGEKVRQQQQQEEKEKQQQEEERLLPL